MDKTNIGERFLDEIIEASNKFCDEMQMTSEQKTAFRDFSMLIIKYILNTSIMSANAVAGYGRKINTDKLAVLKAQRKW